MDVREQMKLQQWAADMAEKKASGLTAAQWCEMKRSKPQQPALLGLIDFNHYEFA